MPTVCLLGSLGAIPGRLGIFGRLRPGKQETLEIAVVLDKDVAAGLGAVSEVSDVETAGACSLFTRVCKLPTLMLPSSGRPVPPLKFSYMNLVRGVI